MCFSGGALMLKVEPLGLKKKNKLYMYRIR